MFLKEVLIGKNDSEKMFLVVYRLETYRRRRSQRSLTLEQISTQRDTNKQITKTKFRQPRGTSSFRKQKDAHTIERSKKPPENSFSPFLEQQPAQARPESSKQENALPESFAASVFLEKITCLKRRLTSSFFKSLPASSKSRQQLSPRQ